MTGNDSEIPADYFYTDAADAAGRRVHRTLRFSRTPTILLAHVVNRSNQLAAEYLKAGPVAIGLVEFKLLVNLCRYPGSTVTSCAERLGIDKGAVSRALAKMEKLGLASQAVSAEDERKKDWSLTKTGLALHEHHIDGLVAFQHDLFAGLSLEDIARLNATLGRMLENIDAMSRTN